MTLSKLAMKFFVSLITGPRLILPQLSGDSVTWERVGRDNQIGFCAAAVFSSAVKSA